MELATTLKKQTLQSRVREVGINPNYWYAVAWAHELKIEQVTPVVVWRQSIALYRDTHGHIHALENACPHRGVELHKGEVKGDRLVCPYHGWELDGNGQCAHIPYLPPDQKLPAAQTRSYPVQEKYGLIWVFPGDPGLTRTQHPPEIPEYSDPNYLCIPVLIDADVHFSIWHENGMDVFHGFLHRHLQGWQDPVLVQLKETDTSVRADYRVSVGNPLTHFLGFSQGNSGVTTRIATIHYQYPHFQNSMEGLSSLYVMRLPIGLNKTRCFTLLFLKQVRLPKGLLQVVKPVLIPLLRNLFVKFVSQDIDMMESEQRVYRENPDRRYVEINPAVVALQRLLVRQYEAVRSMGNGSGGGE